MDKIDLLQKLRRERLVCVVRSKAVDLDARLAAVAQGGVGFLEITLTMPGALGLLERTAAAFRGTDVAVGAGTVLDAATARLAILAGAQFIVAPSFNRDTARICNLYRKAYIPGVQSANEIGMCLEWGADVVKLFPAGRFSPDIVREYQGPFPQAQFMVTGKMDEVAMAAWLEGGAFAVGVGGALVGAGCLSEVETAARRFAQRANQF